MSVPAFIVARMSLPLTRPAPWEEFPAGMETLWPELAVPAERPIQVTVTVPDGDGRRPVMDVVTREDQAVEYFATVFRYAAETEGFEIVVGRYTG
jgi:hypothetical protein